MMTLAFFAGGMPSIGEIGIIALILVLLFGARKLPELARALGSSRTEFKKGKRDGAQKQGIGAAIECEPAIVGQRRTSS